jgi:hypothetical protein
MHASGGKSACKSNKIAKTPMRGSSAEVTPSMKISEGEHAKAKKIKQGKKKRMANFFGQGPCVPAPPRGGTPINAVVQQRENRVTNREEGKGKSPSTESVSLKRSTKVKAMKQLQTEDKGERGQGDGEISKKSTKKSSVRAQMTRFLAKARGPNQMMKDQLLVGSNPTASW